MVNQHPPEHHPLDVHSYSVAEGLNPIPSTVVIFGFTLVTNSVGNRSHI
jgi:hypothetical protein